MTRRHRKPTEDERAGRGLRKVIEVIEDRGWTQGTLVSTSGSVCTLGAIRSAYGLSSRCLFERDANSTESENTTRGLRRWLIREGYSASGSIEGWNDNVATGVDSVLAILRKAADDLDPQDGR